MSELPEEVRELLAVAPAAFVAERKRLAKELRDAGRPEDAKAVADFRKPPPTVLAVNRAARDRPRAAEDASRVAARLVEAQLGNDHKAFAKASEELRVALDLLAEVAVAHVAAPGKRPSEAMRRRVHDLLRSAVATDASREALRKGVLTEESAPTGFDAFAGMTPAPAKRRGSAAASRARQEAAKRRERERELGDELKRATKSLEEAERAARRAEESRAKAEKDVASIRAKLDRL
jgi:hypothetical protein